MNPFYITTPLYYVNDKPHVGTSYSTIIADIFSRYHRFFGSSAVFLTGVDEHGQKCQRSAEQRGLSPQAHCDEMAEIYKKCWKTLDIGYDIFYRTSSPSHKSHVQKALQQLFDSGHIYSADYEGWYCVSEEIFYTDKDLIDGLSPQGRDVTKIKEKSYFFKMSSFREPLIRHLEKNPDFIYPSHRQNEVMGFLKQGLEDLCISRPKSRLEWGIEMPFDSQYVIYVWVDALLNYLFGAKAQPESGELWKNSHHLIGKDILITHGVYWPCLLMALGEPLPRQIIGHGWLLNKDQEKMSKSKGETLDPLFIAENLGLNPLRYFFAKSSRMGQDSPISYSMIIQEYNQDLANNLGNLLQRTLALIESHFEGKIPPHPKDNKDEDSLKMKERALKTSKRVRENIFQWKLSEAVLDVMNFLSSANQYLEKKAPWKMRGKMGGEVKDKKEAALVLLSCLEAVRVGVLLLSPVLPKASSLILKKLNADEPYHFDQSQKWEGLKAGTAVKKEAPIFPRLDQSKS